jgi:hypothetical protein
VHCHATQAAMAQQRKGCFAPHEAPRRLSC